MEIKLEFLKEKSACAGGVEWYQNFGKTELAEIIPALLADNHFKYANWLLCEIFSHEQKIKYAVFAAEVVLHIYEDKYIEDIRPRNAIEAAKNYLESPTEENKNIASAAANSAADAVYSAANSVAKTTSAAAYSAADAAYSAANSAANAAYAVDDAANIAYAAANSAANAVYAAAYAVAKTTSAATSAAADAADAETKTKIINYGMELIGEG